MVIELSGVQFGLKSLRDFKIEQARNIHLHVKQKKHQNSLRLKKKLYLHETIKP